MVTCMKPFQNPTRYRSSLVTSLLILDTIAENKEYAQYDLKKAIEKDYHTVLRHLKMLESNNMIQLLRLETPKKKGKERKIYGLTSLGLIQYLKYAQEAAPAKKDFEDYLEQLAVKHEKLLPLVFGKWRLFEKYRLKEYLIRTIEYALKYEILDCLMTMQTEPILDALKKTPLLFKNIKEMKKQAEKLESAHKDILEFGTEMEVQSLNRSVFFPKAYSFNDAKLSNIEDNRILQLKIFSMAKDDKEISRFIGSEIDRMEKRCVIELESIRSWKQTFSSVR